jgi:hypothetical protein
MENSTGQEAAPLTDDTLASMSDEDFANLDVAHFAEDGGEEDASTDEVTEDESGDGGDEADTEKSESDDQEDDAATDNDAETDTSEDAAESDGDTKESEGEESEAEEGESDKEAEADTQPVDYKAEYEKLLAPFKANGKEIKIENVDDAVQLMKMGANYNKKMTALKPNLKVLKLLENNGLLGEDKLSYLIDLDKKNPDAIKRLIKESGIDPLDIDTEDNAEYQPTTYKVDDRELELDEVLDKIQDSPTYSKTIGVVSKQWDGPSKKLVAEQPQLLEVINDHMASGVYDRISTEVEKQRMLGRLSGMSDLEAYRSTGDELDAHGAFNDLFQGTAQKQPPKQKTVVKKPKAEDPKRADKKRAASSTRTAPNTSIDSDFNPLSLSDEEFEKLGNQKLM